MPDGFVNEDSAFSVMQRLYVDGALALQADFSSITYIIFNSAGATESSGTLTVSSVVFDTVQTDARWTEDLTGYNFLHEVAHTEITDPGLYTIEYKCTLSDSSEVIIGPLSVRVLEVSTS